MRHSKQRPGTGHAPAVEKHSQHYSSKPTVSRYKQKQYERTSLGQAMLSALRGGK